MGQCEVHCIDKEPSTVVTDEIKDGLRTMRQAAELWLHHHSWAQFSFPTSESDCQRVHHTIHRSPLERENMAAYFIQVCEKHRSSRCNLVENDRRSTILS